jgi:hypothetical protein
LIAEDVKHAESPFFILLRIFAVDERGEDAATTSRHSEMDDAEAIT